MARRYNIRRVKIHRNYSVSDLEKLLDVHKHTVRRWIASGLPLIEQRRPYLIHGTDLRAFLAERQPRKQPLRPGEIYCVGCRTPKRPAGNIADFAQRSLTAGTLIGICPTCDRMIHRAVKLSAIDHARGGLEVTLRGPEQRLADCLEPLPNVGFKQDGTSR